MNFPENTLAEEDLESEEEFDGAGRLNDPVARMMAQREARKKGKFLFYLS